MRGGDSSHYKIIINLETTMAYKKIELAPFPESGARIDRQKRTKNYTNKINTLKHQAVKDRAIEEASNGGKCWWVKSYLKA